MATVVRSSAEASRVAATGTEAQAHRRTQQGHGEPQERKAGVPEAPDQALPHAHAHEHDRVARRAGGPSGNPSSSRVDGAVMLRAATTLNHASGVPKLHRLLAGKAGCKSSSFLGDVDADIPAGSQREELTLHHEDAASQPWDDPAKAAQHRELLNTLPQLQVQIRSKEVEEIRNVAASLRELAQGSPETVKEVSDSGIFLQLTALLDSSDLAVVEEAVMAVCHFARNPAAVRRLKEGGVLGALSSSFVRAGEQTPRPHFSIQSNICAAFLELTGGTVKCRGSGIVFGGASLLRSLIRLVEPQSGCNFEGRRDALRLLLLMCERTELRPKLVEFGVVRTMIKIVEAAETELYDDVAALFRAFSKMEEGGREICGLAPLAQAGICTSRSDGNHRVTRRSTFANQDKECQAPATAEAQAPASGVMRSASESHHESLPAESHGLAAVTLLLGPECTPLTQALMLSTVTRLLTKGDPEMTHAVLENTALHQAVEQVAETGDPSCQKKACLLMEAMSKYSLKSARPLNTITETLLQDFNESFILEED